MQSAILATSGPMGGYYYHVDVARREQWTTMGREEAISCSAQNYRRQDSVGGVDE